MTDHRQHQPTSTWEEQLRTKLSTHSAQPPTDLWETIERDLSVLEGATTEQSRAVPLYARWGAAAAVVALTAGLVWWEGNGPDGELTNAKPESGLMATTDNRQTSPAQQPQTAAHSTETTDQNAETTARHAETHARHAETDIRSTSAGGVETHAEHTPALAENKAVQSTQETAEPEEIQIETISTTTLPERVVAEVTDNLTDNDEVLHQRSAKRHKMNLYLAQSNAISNIGGRLYDYACGDADPGPGDYDSDWPPYVPTQTSHYYGEHDEPLKTSVLVRLNLSHRLALDAGLSYTYLHSSLIHRGPAASDRWSGDQRVHYLGVPVNISCYLYESRRWNAYVSTGAEVAKAVVVDWSKDSDFDTFVQKYPSHTLDHPWQLSVTAAVGVQYNFLRRVGIYLQPSFGYFFDNHSRIKTYYTDHPFTPSLQVGLRINVNK